MGIDDLINGRVLQPGDETPLLMAGEVLDVNVTTGQLKVTVPDYDNGKHALSAFGYFPGAQAGDEVRVMIDNQGQVVVVAWQPADA